MTDKNETAQGPEARKAGKRHAMLADLEAIFLEEGFSSVTVDQLAKRLRCSKRALYELAPSKHDLVLVVVDGWLGRIRHLGRIAALEQEGPQRRIAAFVRPGVSETAKAGRQFMLDLHEFEPALELLQDHQRQRTEMLEEIIEDGIRRGRFRPFHAALIAEVFLSAVSRINEPDCLDAAGVGFSQAFDELYDLIFHGMLVEDTEAISSS